MGCGKVQPTGYAIQSLDSSVVVKDMGFQGGRTLSLNLTAPGATQSVQSADAFTGWTAQDIYQYDLKLSDVTDAANPRDITEFSVVCKGGNAKAVFTHLKPGIKYQITVLAKGNKGGTAATTTLNTQVAAVGTVDLSNAAPDSGAVELTTTIRVQLDGAYERNGAISLLPLDGNTISDDAEAGQGYCGDCDEDRIDAGTTSYDSTFAGGTSGDPFSSDAFNQHWTNEQNGSAWLQRDLGGTYAISGIFVRHAYSDLRFAPATSIKLKLQAPDGTWTTVKTFSNTNLHFYGLTLDTPVNAKAFRLEMTSGNGWFSATGLVLKGTAVQAGNNAGNTGNNGNTGSDGNNGHGNDEGGVDPSNPGNSTGTQGGGNGIGNGNGNNG